MKEYLEALENPLQVIMDDFFFAKFFKKCQGVVFTGAAEIFFRRNHCITSRTFERISEESFMYVNLKQSLVEYLEKLLGEETQQEFLDSFQGEFLNKYLKESLNIWDKT